MESIDKVRGTFGNKQSEPKAQVSSAVIRRLPRYHRCLGDLLRAGKLRISSAELSRIMNVTASQIRQDLNCFGGFGQQGYGYNVNYLYTKICEILGVGCGFRAAVIGAGNLGSALVRSPMFEKRGVDVVAMFDVSENVVGKKIGNVKVYHMNELGERLAKYGVDIAILTLPKEYAPDVAAMLENSSIKGIWNFMGKEIQMQTENVVVENVHIGDSLMTLCYEVAKNMYQSDNKD